MVKVLFALLLGLSSPFMNEETSEIQQEEIIEETENENEEENAIETVKQWWEDADTLFQMTFGVSLGTILSLCFTSLFNLATKKQKQEEKENNAKIIKNIAELSNTVVKAAVSIAKVNESNENAIKQLENIENHFESGLYNIVSIVENSNNEVKGVKIDQQKLNEAFNCFVSHNTQCVSNGTAEEINKKLGD